MRVLMIADYIPYPMVGGDRVRIYNLLRRVASRHEVSLVAFVENPQDLDGVRHLEQICTKLETAVIRRHSPLTHLPGVLRYALEGKPPELRFLHSSELENKIRRLASLLAFDIVQIEHARMGLYLQALPANKPPKSILMFHNFTFQQDSRIFHVEKCWDKKLRVMLNSIAMLHWEPRYAEQFDRCTTVSEIDRRLLLDANPRLQVDVIPNGVDIHQYEPLPPAGPSPRLLFIGNMEYPPCVDAVLHFTRSILPLIQHEIDGVEFWIVGRNPRKEVLQLDGGCVHVTGRVEDVVPYYRQCSVCVVPLRAGGGTRLKILEAMALGRPVVSTTIGCEGLAVTDGEHLSIADDPPDFARATVRLLTDPQLYQHIATNGRLLVETVYDWDQIAERLMQVYAELAAGHSSSAGVSTTEARS